MTAKKKTKTVRRKAKTSPRLVNCLSCLEKYDPRKNHDCHPPNERDLFRMLDEDLQDAFAALKDRASGFGDQKIYNNARAVMFSRRVCYMFVRPKKSHLELCFFLPRKEASEGIKRIAPVSKTKFAHTVRLVHADQVEAPLLDWLGEAYRFAE